MELTSVEQFVDNGWLDHPFIECYLDRQVAQVVNQYLALQLESFNKLLAGSGTIESCMACIRPSWRFFLLDLWEGPRDCVYHRFLASSWKTEGRRSGVSEDFWRLLGEPRFYESLMSDEDLVAFSQLRPPIRIYRASFDGVVRRPSWTISRESAIAFAKASRERMKIYTCEVLDFGALISAFSRPGYIEVMVAKNFIDHAELHVIQE